MITEKIKDFLNENPNSTALQIYNAVGGEKQPFFNELKRLIAECEVTYSLIDYTFCVRKKGKKK